MVPDVVVSLLVVAVRNLVVVGSASVVVVVFVVELVGTLEERGVYRTLISPRGYTVRLKNDSSGVVAVVGFREVSLDVCLCWTSA